MSVKQVDPGGALRPSVAREDPAGASIGPASPPAELYCTALAHHRAGRLSEAEPVYRRLLARAPDWAQAWTNYGALLRKTGRLKAAIAAHRRALAIEPESGAIMNNLANALADHGAFEEAAALRRDLLAAESASPERLRDLCAALRGLGQNEEAVALVDRAEAEGWADGEGLLQRGLALLTLGEWKRGFADFEHRYAGDEVRLPESLPWPRWRGEPVESKRILVLPEQGFGDALLMCRFLPGLVAMGAEVSMMVKPPLARLLSSLPGIAILTEVRRSDRFDLYTPNMSLPHFVGAKDWSAPPPPPPLTIPPGSRARAAAIVAPFQRHFRVGVVWTGSLTFKANNRRSTTPESFLGLALVPGVQLFSLYKGDAYGAFLASGMAGHIVDACGDERDFADTAALIEELDLVIGTDTAVLHLAGALGKPVWNLLSREGFWLYGRGDTTPWYPTMRLWRQEVQGDWPGLFARVEAALRAHPPLAQRGCAG